MTDDKVVRPGIEWDCDCPLCALLATLEEGEPVDAEDLMRAFAATGGEVIASDDWEDAGQD